MKSLSNDKNGQIPVPPWVWIIVVILIIIVAIYYVVLWIGIGKFLIGLGIVLLIGGIGGKVFINIPGIAKVSGILGAILIVLGALYEIGIIIL